MPGPTSSPPTGVSRRVIASPRNAQDLKLRLASVDENRNSLYAYGLVSPLTGLMSSSPSQLQPLTPALNGRPYNGASGGGGGGNSSWTPSSNLLSTSNRTVSSPHESSSCNNSQKAKGQAPPALEIVSPIAAPAESHSNTSVQGRGALPELSSRKDPEASSVDVSTERCTLSPSSAGGCRSTAFTPTFETSNNASTVAQHRASTSVFCEMATPPPNAPRSYSKRAAGSRDSVPAQRPSVSSGVRTAAPATNLESPTRHGAAGNEEPSPLRRLRHSIDTGNMARTGDMPIDYDTHRSGGGSSVSDYATYHAHTPTAAASGVASRVPALSPASSPSAPTTPAVGPRGRTAQMESILATSALNTGGSTQSVTGGGSGPNGSHTSAHTPSNRSHHLRGRSARAPHLASHLFLDSSTQDSGTPASGAQSPAIAEVRRRGGSRSSSGRGGRSRSSRGSSEGRVSISTESSSTFLTPVLNAARPNALNFARGELIGKGSFGAVYRGMQRNTNQIVCMKEVRLPGVAEELRQKQSVDEGTTPRGGTSTPPPPPLSPATPDATAMDAKEKGAQLKEIEGVKRELAVLKQLNHPNIVKYLNDEVVDGYLRIYMEYVSGGSVASAVKTYGSFQEPQAAALCYQLLQGLSYLHSHGIVHRDLKGDNLLLETSSVLKIADFGTAKSIIASATMTANIVGTAYFMAPEVLRPEGLSGTPADIWSTGCCVIEMLTGKPPLSEIPNQYSVMMTIAGSPKVPLEKYIPADNTWSPAVLDFIKQCLRLNAATRPTAQELLRHPWILQYCEKDDVAASATPITVPSSPAPTVAPMDSPRRSPSAAASAAASSSRRTRQPDPPLTPASSDAVRIATAATPTAAPRPPTRCSSADTRDGAAGPASASREKKAKREKKSVPSSRRQYGGARDPNTDQNAGAGSSTANTSSIRDESTPSRAMHATPSAPPGISGTTPSVDPQHPALTRPTADLFAKVHYLAAPSSLSAKDDDRHQSFSYDYPLPSPARTAELTLQASGIFLPAIPGALSSSSTAPPASLTMSTDGLRAHRLSRQLNVSSSRDDTRAYHYPNEEDYVSRDSMRGGGRDFFLDAQDYGRDGADGLVHYGSTTRMQVPDSHLEPGLYSTLDCLTAPPPPTVDDVSPSTTSRRSTSKRPAGRGTL